MESGHAPGSTYICSDLLYHQYGCESKTEKKQLPTDTDSYDEQGYVQADGSYVHMEKNILKEKGDEPYADSSTK